MNELLSHITEVPVTMPKTTFIQIDALPVEKYPETVRQLEPACPIEIRKRAQHNHKIIEALREELKEIRQNPIYKFLAFLEILPKGGK